jgi:ribonuclease Z
MEAFILGCGGMMPLPNRHLTSMMLRREGDLFLFDCGEGTQVSLKRLNLKWKKIDAIFISHTHADHITGLPGILMLNSQVDRDTPLYIIGPPKLASFVSAMRDTLDMYINYEIIVKEIDPSQRQVVFEADEFIVSAFPLKHRKPCVGYKFEEKPRNGTFYPDKALALNIPRGSLWSMLQNGHSVNVDGRTITSDMVVGNQRRGRKVCFVTDTLYIDSIAKDVEDSDLLICEGMFTHDLVETATEKQHLTAKQAGMIGADAKVLKMGLIHYSPRFIDKELPHLLDEAKQLCPQAFLSRDRMIIDIPYRD